MCFYQIIATITIAVIVYFLATIFTTSAEIPEVHRNGVFGDTFSAFGNFQASYVNNDKGPFKIAIIADLDKQSKVGEESKWRSVFRQGTLERDGQSFVVNWEEGELRKWIFFSLLSQTLLQKCGR